MHDFSTKLTNHFFPGTGIYKGILLTFFCLCLNDNDIVTRGCEENDTLKHMDGENTGKYKKKKKKKKINQ